MLEDVKMQTDREQIQQSLIQLMLTSHIYELDVLLL